MSHLREWRGDFPLLFGHRWSRGRWYLAVRPDTYFGFLVPGMVITLVGALSSPVAMAACFRDSYGWLDHLSSDGFDYGNDGLFDPPRSFLH